MAFARLPRRATRRPAARLGLLALEDRTVPAAVVVPDFGFEAAAVNGFRYTPAGTPWAFAGSAGLAANAGPFTAGNPAAPQGGQVAFLQNKGGLSQSVTLAAGTYTLSFAAAQRGNVASRQTFEVLVDGKVVGSFNGLTGTGYAALTTSSFTVTAGPHTITFQGTNLNGGDNTVLIDQVTITQQPAGLADGGFEMPAVAAGAYKYGPTGTPWTYFGTAGVASDGSGFTAANPAAPQASQVAFIQGTGGIRQAVTFAAGTYTISFSAAQRGNWGSQQTLQVLVDGKVVGTFNTLTGSGYTALTTSSFTVAAGTHTVTFQGTNAYGGDATALIDQVAITRELTNLTDSGFEGAVVPGAGFDYNPAGTPWTFGGSAGVSGNGTGFTAGNPAAPQGGLVAFLQGTGSVTQAVTFPAGTYAISFAAAQRGNAGNPQTLQVLVDGKVVGTFNTITGTAYSGFLTDNFTVTAGSHTVTFKGTNLNGGDSTLFVDQVGVTQATAGLSDSGFETAALGSGGFSYGPTGTPWSFFGSAGVAGNGGAFTAGNPTAPEGTQVAFLQGTGSMNQAMSFAAGTYTLSFAAAQRGNVPSHQTFQVLVDGAVVGTFNTVTGTGYSQLTTSSFTVTDGSHTVTFQGTNLNGGDNTALIDQVALNQQPTGLADTGFESPAVDPGTFQYAPASSAWSFTGSAGVAANGSAFTAGNPAAPQGGQVAFLQGKASLTQTATFTAGTYKLSFAAAQRGNVAGAQTLQVLVDGTVVGTFNGLKGAAYGTLTTAAFTVTDGTHIVTFQGTNGNGDNTAFIDQVSVSAA